MTNEDIFFIEELIEWVEIHLEKRPNLDEVARISGYSKWHLQRKFKRITGIQLATYIRSRILTRAAVALRITRRSIIDISDELGFDSQQTFTRMFKQRFNITPNRYRAMEHWDVKNLMPRFNFEASYGAGYYPEVKRLTLPDAAGRLHAPAGFRLRAGAGVLFLHGDEGRDFQRLLQGAARRLPADLQHLFPRPGKATSCHPRW